MVIVLVGANILVYVRMPRPQQTGGEGLYDTLVLLVLILEGVQSCRTRARTHPTCTVAPYTTYLWGTGADPAQRVSQYSRKGELN